MQFNIQTSLMCLDYSDMYILARYLLIVYILVDHY